MSTDWLSGTNFSASEVNYTIKQIIVSKDGNCVVGYMRDSSNNSKLFFSNNMLSDVPAFTVATPIYNGSAVPYISGICVRKEFVVGSDYVYFTSYDSKYVYYVTNDFANASVVYKIYNNVSGTGTILTLPNGVQRDGLACNYNGTMLYANLTQTSVSVVIANGYIDSDTGNHYVDPTHALGYIDPTSSVNEVFYANMGFTKSDSASMYQMVGIASSNTVTFINTSTSTESEGLAEYVITIGQYSSNEYKYVSPHFFITKNIITYYSGDGKYVLTSGTYRMTSSNYTSTAYRKITVADTFPDTYTSSASKAYIQYNAISADIDNTVNSEFLSNIYTGVIEISTPFANVTSSSLNSDFSPFDINSSPNTSDGLTSNSYNDICCDGSSTFVTMCSSIYTINEATTTGCILSSNTIFNYTIVNNADPTYFTSSGLTLTYKPTVYTRDYQCIACSGLNISANNNIPTLMVATFPNDSKPYIIYSLNGGGACFLKDTNITILENNIETEKQIQNLQKGDLVKIGFNKYKKIMSIGKNSFDITKNLDLIRVLPQNSISKNIPYQDLYIVTGHSLLFEDLKYANDEYKPEIYKNNIVNEDYVYEDYDDN